MFLLNIDVAARCFKKGTDSGNTMIVNCKRVKDQITVSETRKCSHLYCHFSTGMVMHTYTVTCTIMILLGSWASP